MPLVAYPLPPGPVYSAVHRSVFWTLLAIGVLVAGSDNSAWAQRSRKTAGRVSDMVVHDYSSIHFLVHTDLGPKEAAELLRQLETMVKFVATYWGRPPSGILECYVAKDLSTWPPAVLGVMEAEGIAKIQEGAGVCIGRTASSGNRFVAKARVYAIAKEGVPQHEAVHGYCMQTFGRSGPQWYAEGMAELGHYWINGQKGVNVPPVVIQFLRESPPRRLESLIVNDERIGGTWQDYAWWWFLCHLLENNPNYSGQFRALGPELLMGKDTGFRQVFGARIRELTFEYQFFLQHLESGYRVDLCAWDWKRRFTPLTSSARTILVPVQANRGWQATGLTVAAATQYAYSTTGTWRTDKDGEPVDAKGGGDGAGRLVGVLMQDYRLGEEFELGESGSFKAPANGNLYLRCRDTWNQLADNAGRITVKIKLSAGSQEAEGKAEEKAKETAEEK